MSNSPNPKLSVIIPAYNSESTIELCLDSIIKQKIPRENYEIIVVDDASSDNTAEIAKKSGADLVLQNEKNCGAGNARNLGVKNSKGKFIAFLDSDCRAQEGWIKAIFENIEKFQAITGPIENGNPHSPIAWAEYFIEMGAYHKYKKQSWVRTIPGGNGAYTREIFFKAGGFGEQRLSEDFWLCESLERLKVNRIFVPELKIVHMNRTELGKFCANMQVQGKFFVRNRKMIASSHHKYLVKSPLCIPLIFGLKFGKSFFDALSSRNAAKFLQSFPYVIYGLIHFCRGNFEEMKKFDQKEPYVWANP